MATARSDSKYTLAKEKVAQNPFFQILRKNYHELYALAAKRGWKILIPHSNTFQTSLLNEHFFKSHILQSSPYLKEEFVTLNGQCVILKGNGTITTKTGFDRHVTVNIIGEELFYDSSFKAYTVYIINAPLLSAVSHVMSDDDGDEFATSKREAQIFQTLIEDRNEHDWKIIMSSAIDDASVYKQLLKHTNDFQQQFNRSYVMIKGYTSAASKRIEEFRTNVLDQLLLHPPTSNNHRSRNGHKKHARQMDNNTLQKLTVAFDCYLNSILFDRIFNTFLVRHFNVEDEVFCHRLKSLQQTVSQTDVGVKTEFQSALNFECAVNKLLQLNTVQTPINKLGILQETFKRIRDEIETQQQRQKRKRSQAQAQAQKHDDPIPLTTDDNICMFTFVLIQAASVSNLLVLTNNEYIKHFYFGLNHHTAHLEYFRATLQAAITFLYHLSSSKQKSVSQNNASIY